MTDPTPSDVTAHGTQRIKIFDTTLRDGEQSPGFTMNAAQKVLFAQALEELGVDVIEAGFPNSSPADFGAVQSIAREIRHASIAALARCHPADIDACASALPSRCIHGGRPSRSSGRASAVRARRVALGNCLCATTQALTSTASAITRYCSASAGAISPPPA